MLKKILRITALVLVLSLCIQIVPPEVMASVHKDDIVSNAEVHDIFGAEKSIIVDDSTIVCEISEKREETIKQFRLTDGSIAAAIYDIPVHEKDENGNWSDIDNTLVLTTRSDKSQQYSKLT